MKLEKASDKGGRYSWLVNWVFGKMKEVVVVTKFDREVAVVVLLVGWCGSERLIRGLEQHPWKHARPASLVQGDNILS